MCSFEHYCVNRQHTGSARRQESLPELLARKNMVRELRVWRVTKQPRGHLSPQNPSLLALDHTCSHLLWSLLAFPGVLEGSSCGSP
jgi:hypothetical protein